MRQPKTNAAQNPFNRLLQLVVNFWQRPIRIPRAPAHPSRAYPSRDRKGAVAILHDASMTVAPLTKEQMRAQLRELLREELRELLAQPETARARWRPVSGTAFPFTAGAPSTNYIPKLNSEGTPVDTGTPIFEKDGNKIGIGTTTPLGRLHISGGYFFVDSNLQSAPPNVFGLAVGVNYTGGEGETDFFSHKGDTGTVGGYRFYDWNGTTATLLVTIQGGGNVGIGTTSPLGILDVVGTPGASDWMYFRGNASGTNPSGSYNWGLGLSVNRSGGQGEVNLVFGTGSGTAPRLEIGEWTGSAYTADVVIKAGGNVGIGTASPAEKLDVIGNIKSDGLNKIIFLRPLGGTQDDEPQIQAAINALPSNGGIIMLTPGTYRIGSTISITNKNGVKIRGYGGNFLDQNATPLTVLQWTPSSGGPVIEFVATVEDAPVSNAELSNLKIDAQSGAAFGILLSYVTTSRFKNLLVKWATDIGIHLTTAIAVEHENNLGNLFENCAVWGAPHGIVLDGKTETSGDPPVTIYYGDSSQNIFVNTQVSYDGTSDDSAAGIWLKSADANVFIRTSLWRDGTHGNGVVFEDPQHAVANYFYHLGPGDGGVIVKHADNGVSSEGKNMIFGYTIPDAAPSTDPSSVAPEKVLAWIDSMGNMSGFRLKHYALGSVLSSTNWPLVENNQMATCWDTQKFWLLVQESGNKWKLEMQQLT